MKKILTLFYVLILSSPAFGTTYNFTDTVNHWAGWGNGSNQDNRDTIGYPKFSGGSYTINDATGRLTGITFDYSGWASDIYNYIKPGDLFLDLGKDGDWDYAVKSYSESTLTNCGLYSLKNLPINPALEVDRNKYMLSNETWPLSSGTIRNQHPVAIRSSILGQSEGDVLFGGWHYGLGNFTTYYDFSGLNGGLNIGPGDFQFGFTINCANDVVLAQGTNPVPEPTTMLLLGIGLIGMAGFAGRRHRA